MRNITISLVALFSLLPAAAAAGPKVNAATNIDWTKVAGTGAPTSTCNSSFFGEPYTDTATGNFYVCAASGWLQVSGGGGGGGLSGQNTNFLPKATSATASTTSSVVEDTGTGIKVHGSGPNTALIFPEATPVSGSASNDIFDSDANTHRWLQNPNNTGNTVVVGTSTTPSTAGHCAQYASNGYDLSDAGAACGSGGGGAAPFGGTGTTNALVNSVSTLAAAITACGVTPTTIQITIALTPNTIAVPKNCTLQFYDGGAINPPIGQTVTINGPIQAPMNQQIFGGLGTIVIGPVQTWDTPEWFGGVADGNYSTGAGTDNTTIFQTASNALAVGVTILQCAQYKITAPVTVTRSGIGFRGLCHGDIYDTQHTIVFSNSATTDGLRFWGTSDSVFITNNVVENIDFRRSVATSGATTANFSFKWMRSAQVKRLLSQDSTYNFYMASFSAGAEGSAEDTTSAIGFVGVAPLAIAHVGYYLDTSNSQQNLSTILTRPAAAVASSVLGSYIGILDTGSYLSDLMVTGYQGFQNDIGFEVNDTSGSTGVASWDIQCNDCINDSNFGSAYLVQSLNPSQTGAFSVHGGAASSKGGSNASPIIDVESSYGVTVDGVQVFAYGSQSVPYLYANSSAYVSFVNNNINVGNTATNCIKLNASLYSVVANNTCAQIFPAATSATFISLAGSTYNTISANTMANYGAVGIALDATSNNNKVFANVASNNITTPLTNAGSGNVIDGSVFDANTLGTPQYVAGAGTANAQTVTLSPAVTSLSTGIHVRWKPSVSNTGATTLAVNGLTAVNVTKCGTTALVAGDLTSGVIADATYDGTQFQLQNPNGTACAGGAPGVSQIIAGTNVTISPPGGTGAVTINASGGGGSYPATEAHTASSSASLSFTTCGSTFTSSNDYEIRFANIVPATNNVDLLMQFNSDTTTGHYSWATWRWLPSASGQSGSNSTTAIELSDGNTQLSSSSTNAISGRIVIHNATLATGHKAVDGTGFEELAGPANLGIVISGDYLQNTAITSIQFKMSSGNIASGTITCQPMPN